MCVSQKSLVLLIDIQCPLVSRSSVSLDACVELISRQTDAVTYLDLGRTLNQISESYQTIIFISISY